MAPTPANGNAVSVSVALASYNGAAFIGEQLASIAAQTRLPDELVVSDDGSSDGTMAIVEEFARAAPFPVIRLRQAGRLGILENFRAAFAACTGDVIAYCDQDDVWRPEKLAWQLAALAPEVMLVLHPSEVVDGDLRPLGRRMPGNPRHGVIPAPVDAAHVYGFGHQMLFRRAVWTLMRRIAPAAEQAGTTRMIGNFDGFIPFCASLLGSIAVLDDPLVRFRRHAGATSPAGLEEATPPLAARARAAIARDRSEAEEALALLEIATGEGIEDTGIVRSVRRALERKRAYAGGDGRVAMVARAVGAAASPPGFGNDRRLRPLKLALAAALG